MLPDFNAKDRDIWDGIFQNVPGAWMAAPPSVHMTDCLEFFKPRNVETVLDAGCGVGRWSIFLARHGFLVSGCDFSENAIRFAREWATRERLAAEFDVAPVTAIPFNGEIFDGVVAALVLDSLSRREMAIAIDGFHDRLRRGGLLYALF